MTTSFSFEKLLFDKKDQKALLEQWRTCAEYGMTTKDFCQKLANSQSSSVRKIGEAGLNAPGQGKTFTEVLEGWLSPVALSTLIIAEKNGQLRHGLDIALNELEGGQNVMMKLFAITAFPLLVFFGLGTLGVYISGEIIQTADLEGTMATTVRDFVSGPGLVFFTTLMALGAIISLVMPWWTGPARTMADNVWPFCDYRYGVAGNLLSTLGHLSEAGISLTGAIEEVRPHSNRYLRYHLEEVKTNLETESNPGRAFDTGLLLHDAQDNLNVVGDIAPLTTLLNKSAEQHKRHLQKKMATMSLIVPKVILLLAIALLISLVGSAMGALFISIQL
ncbi:hypothetical protein BS333_21475 (plasmid) [Vibrio azureus]|nr:type II secretion system F family protein [Vibrio azureus]AUI88954.1 hypothetical protein BS333_21475 [Vibrio azureus]